MIFNQWFIILLSIRDISWNVHQSGSSYLRGFYFWWRYQFGAFHENAIKFPHHQMRGISWNWHQIFASSFAGLLFLLLLSIRGYSWNYTTFATSLLKSFSYCYQFGVFHENVHQSSPHYLRGFYLWCRYQFGAFLENAIKFPLVKFGAFHSIHQLVSKITFIQLMTLMETFEVLQRPQRWRHAINLVNRGLVLIPQLLHRAICVPIHLMTITHHHLWSHHLRLFLLLLSLHLFLQLPPLLHHPLHSLFRHLYFVKDLHQLLSFLSFHPFHFTPWNQPVPNPAPKVINGDRSMNQEIMGILGGFEERPENHHYHILTYAYTFNLFEYLGAPPVVEYFW